MSPSFWKTWDIGSTIFQCPPVCENVGHWKTVLPMFHVFRTGVNQQNQGIMKRFHVSPRDLWGNASPRTSKTVLGTLRFARVPRTVFEVLGLDIPQGPSENRGTLAHFDHCTTNTWHLTWIELGTWNMTLTFKIQVPWQHGGVTTST